MTVAAGVAGRWPWLLVVAASLGTATWALAASVARTNGWFEVSTRLQLYVGGLVAVVVSIAVWAWFARRAARLSSGDLVRDDGRGGVRLAFRGEHGEFEDIAGERFAAAPGESTVLVDLGGDLGEVLLAHGFAPIETGPFARTAARRPDDRRAAPRRHPTVGPRRRSGTEPPKSPPRRNACALPTNSPPPSSARSSSGWSCRGSSGRSRNSTAIRPTSPPRRECRSSLVVDEIEGLAAGLVPTALDGGLCAALATIADQDMVSVRCDVDDSTIDPSIALVLYFAATECVTNALRHGAPSLVAVDLHDDEPRADMVELTVTDDGRGGAEAHVDGSGGLAGLRSRVDAASGTVEVGTRVGGGTVVTVRLPRRAPSAVVLTPL